MATAIEENGFIKKGYYCIWRKACHFIKNIHRAAFSRSFWNWKSRKINKETLPGNQPHPLRECGRFGNTRCNEL